MNRLMSQALDYDHTRQRTSRIRIDRATRVIAYKSRDGSVFYIDTKPIESGGEPIVRTLAAELYSAAHKTHTLGGGQVCLARSLRGWDLTRILFQCDSWARGYAIYLKTGNFPRDPKETFSRQAHS